MRNPLNRFAAFFLLESIAILGAPMSAGEKAKAFVHTPEETRIFELTNEERKKVGASALILNPALSRIARAHSANMARQGKLEHKLDDKSVDDRLREGGYRYLEAGENLAWGEKGAALPDIMKDWMESKGHRANIVDKDFTEIGIGYAEGKKGEMYFTQVFGTPMKK